MLNMNLTVGINHTQATRTNTTTRNSIYTELWIRVTVSRVICWAEASIIGVSFSYFWYKHH